MSLDIILGPMFAGKSSRILSIVSRHISIGRRVLVVKHIGDNRYGDDDAIVTHDRRTTPCVRVASLNELRNEQLLAFDTVIVDEAHFFRGLVPFVRRAVDEMGKSLFLVGLDGDSNRMPFGELLMCIPLADRVERVEALCRRCADGTPGIFTYRRQGPRNEQVIVGGSELYETLCRQCYLRQTP